MAAGVDSSDGAKVEFKVPEMPYKPEYCPICSFPPEYCEYAENFAACKPWLEEHHPDLFPFLRDGGAVDDAAEGVSKIHVGDGVEDGEEDVEEAAESSGAAASGGKGKVVVDQKRDPKVFVLLRDRAKGKGYSAEKTKKKRVATGVVGVDLFGVRPSEAASVLGKAHGAGGTVTKSAAGADEVQIQGNFLLEVPKTLAKKFPTIPKNKIFIIEDGKARLAEFSESEEESEEEEDEEDEDKGDRDAYW